MITERILNSEPVNKTAKLVTSQAGCMDIETIQQKKESIALRVQQLKREICGLPKNHKLRKNLGCEMQRIQVEAQKLNKQLKISNVMGVSFETYIVKVCRGRLGKAVWQGVLREARELKLEAEKNISEGCG